ncbi:MAG: ABC transporter substrate-binding protein, partial [Thermomicrobiales bacterium]
MTDPRIADLAASARTGRLSRRDVLAAGLKLGLATPVIVGLMAAAPEVGAAPKPASRFPRPADESNGTTFVYLRDGGSPDIDPHYAYENAAQAIILGAYEMLIQYKGDNTDQFEPMLAESWTASDDKSTYTFKLYPNVKFHDGDPCTAKSVYDSFTRFLLQNAGPVNVLKRFMPDVAMMKVVDDLTISFSLGRPQPLFLPAMAASYGPFVINTKYVDQNKTTADPYAHEWFRQNANGTGPYMVTENAPTEQVVLKKFDGFHGGWDGNHFDTIVCRIVQEVATRRQLVETGSADATTQNLTPDDVDVMCANTDLQVLTYPATAVFWAIMNAVKR